MAAAIGQAAPDTLESQYKSHVQVAKSSQVAPQVLACRVRIISPDNAKFMLMLGR
jgi:hypothetical protein